MTGYRNMFDEYFSSYQDIVKLMMYQGSVASRYNEYAAKDLAASIVFYITFEVGQKYVDFELHQYRPATLSRANYDVLRIISKHDPMVHFDIRPATLSFPVVSRIYGSSETKRFEESKEEFGKFAANEKIAAMLFPGFVWAFLYMKSRGVRYVGAEMLSMWRGWNAHPDFKTTRYVELERFINEIEEAAREEIRR